MNRTKILLGITAMLTILAITATAASAFTAVSGTGGVSQARAGTLAELTIGAGTIISSKTPDTWRIQDSKSEQRVTKTGPHLDQTINFENPILAQEPRIPVSINNPITIQVTQNGTALISKEVVVTLTLSATKSCKITLEPEANKALTKVSYATTETKNLEVIGTVGGITNTATAACAEVGVAAGKAGKFVATSIEHEIKLV
jgi:hypothetical protein